MELNLDRIKAFLFDVDGVLTDSTAICSTTNDEAVRAFNEKDGHGMRMAVLNGYGLGVITGGRCNSVKMRVMRFGVKEDDVYLHAKNKVVAFLDYCSRHGYDPSEVAYFGDDIPDIAVMKICGLAIAPADAVDEAKEAADYVSENPGGKCCVRKGIEMVLKAQDKWHFDVDKYDALF